MAIVGLALLVVFVLIGIIVGIFFSTIILQRIVQSHFHLLAMRAEASRFRVKDLAQHHADEEAPNTGTAGSSSSFSSSTCSSSATGAQPFSQPQEIARQA